MIYFYVLLVFISLPFTSFAKNELSEFNKIRNNNFEVTKVFETNDFYFSQVSYDWEKKSNRKVLSRQGIVKSINMFKAHIFKSTEIPNSNKLENWGTSLYIKSKLKFTKSRKIEDRRYKNKYLVVFSFPKKNVNFKIDEINIGNMIAFNAKNHTKLSKNERDKFLQKLGFKDLVLLWNIYELDKKYNLINVLDKVNPIQYQKQIMDIIKIEKPNLSLLDKTPSFSYIIDNYLKNNKPTSKYEYLAVLSSKCAYDNDFRDNLIKNEIDTSKENYFSIGKSTILDSLSKCNGFLRFQKELSKPFSIDMSKIDNQFSQGKDLEGIILRIEKALSKSPLTFKLWNYYSACLRAKKLYKEALFVSRVEISIALQLNDMSQYTEALKSYSLSKIKILTNYNKQQKQFLETVL
jgi:hypothetical protein